MCQLFSLFVLFTMQVIKIGLQPLYDCWWLLSLAKQTKYKHKANMMNIELKTFDFIFALNLKFWDVK